MRDFPMFTTEYGVASLVLREIPYREEAYITILSSEQPEELLEVVTELQESARNFDTFEEWFAYMEEYKRELERQRELRR